jgi:hypothetical protein
MNVFSGLELEVNYFSTIDVTLNPTIVTTEHANDRILSLPFAHE